MMMSLLPTVSVLLLMEVVGILSDENRCINKEYPCLNGTKFPPTPPVESCCSKKLFLCYNTEVCLVYIERNETCNRFVPANIKCRPPSKCNGITCV